jgi:hypothetical protein
MTPSRESADRFKSQLNLGVDIHSNLPFAKQRVVLGNGGGI